MNTTSSKEINTSLQTCVWVRPQWRTWRGRAGTGAGVWGGRASRQTTGSDRWSSAAPADSPRRAAAGSAPPPAAPPAPSGNRPEFLRTPRTSSRASISYTERERERVITADRSVTSRWGSWVILPWVYCNSTPFLTIFFLSPPCLEYSIYRNHTNTVSLRKWNCTL